MKLSMTHEDLLILINELKECNSVGFSTKTESRIIGSIIKNFTRDLMIKYMKEKPTYKLTIDDQTLISLDYVLPLINTGQTDPYSLMRLTQIYETINRACLSI